MEKIIFAVETSCDETACALYGTKSGLLGERLYSQWRRHAAYGGVVPELASRDHLRRLLPLCDELLRRAGARPTLVAYTRGPGLAGALLAGAATAQTLAVAWRLPVVGVNHLEGHLLSPLLLRVPPDFPYVALLVSGGHSQLWLVRGRGRYFLLGETFDDSAGEAFDKVAVLLGLKYPGGAALEKLAATSTGGGDARLPSPAQREFDFSFSGLKTAAGRLVGVHPPADIAAAFQRAAAEGLARQAKNALRRAGMSRLAAVGGVAQNAFVAARLRDAAESCGGTLWRPPLRHCGDNAAMIAVAAAHQEGGAPGGFDVLPRWRPKSVAKEGLEPPTRGL